MAKTTSPAPPRDDAPDLPQTLHPQGNLTRGALIDGAEFSELTATDGSSATLVESVLRGVSAEEVTLSFATITDVEFRDVRIASLRMRGAGLTRVRFIGGRIGTLDLTESKLDAVVFDGVRIDYLSLGRTQVTDLDVRDSRIDTLDAPAARLTRVRFSGSQSREFDPREAIARDVDLRGLDFSGITNIASLRGMTISPSQAESAADAMAIALGIVVRD